MEAAYFPFLLLPNDRQTLPTHTLNHTLRHQGHADTYHTDTQAGSGHIWPVQLVFDQFFKRISHWLTAATANLELKPTLTQISGKFFGNAYSSLKTMCELFLSFIRSNY